MTSARSWIGRSALLAVLTAAAVAGTGSSYADSPASDPGYAGRPHMGLMEQTSSTAPPGTGGIKAPPSTVPPGTGGIKPLRPTKPIKPGMPVKPTWVTVGSAQVEPPVKPIPRPKPKPRPAVDPIPVDTDPPVKDPNIVGYAADGSPIYPWGPRPQPPKPVKDELDPAGEVDPNQGPPIVRPDRFPPAAEVR